MFTQEFTLIYIDNRTRLLILTELIQLTFGQHKTSNSVESVKFQRATVAFSMQTPDYPTELADRFRFVH